MEKVNTENSVGYIRLKNANHKPENGIEMVKKNFFLLVTRRFWGEYFVKDLDLEKINCKFDNFVNHIDRGANNFIQNNTNSLFEPTKTRPRRSFAFKFFEWEDAF